MLLISIKKSEQFFYTYVFLKKVKKDFYVVKKIGNNICIKHFFLLEMLHMNQIFKNSMNFMIRFDQVLKLDFFKYNKNFKCRKTLSLKIFSKIDRTIFSILKTNLPNIILKKIENQKIIEKKFSKFQKHKFSVEKHFFRSIFYHNLRKNRQKKFSNLFNFNLSDHQQNGGYFDTKGKRIKNFSTLWDEARWIFFMFNVLNNKKNLHFSIISNFLEIIFLILVYIQTGKINNYYFYYIENQSNIWISDKFNQLIILYKIFLLDRKWCNNIIIREKTANSIKHLEHTTDLINDNFLNLRREHLTLNKIKKTTFKQETLINSYIINTIDHMSLLDFIVINLNKKSNFYNQKIFIRKDEKKKLKYDQINYLIEHFLFKFKYDIRFWNSSCIDSLSKKILSKINYGFFSIIDRKIKLISFAFLPIEIFKKILQILPKKNLYFNSIQNIKNQKLNFYIKSFIENSWKFNLEKNKNPNLYSIFIYSNKKYIQEIKIFFREIFQTTNFFIIPVLFNIFYYFLSILNLKEFNQFFYFETKLILDLNIASRFFKLLISHGKNIFLKNFNKKKKVSKNICFIKIVEKIKKGKRINICLSVGLNLKLKKIKRFKLSLNKKFFLETLFFFCAKYRINIIIMEANSFLERSTSVFIKLQLNDKCGLKKTSECFIKKFYNRGTFCRYVKMVIIEKNSIIYELSQSNILKARYSSYSHRLIALTKNFIEENIIIYLYFLSGEKLNLKLKIFSDFYDLKFSLIYNILYFVFGFIFSKIEIDPMFFILKKNMLPFLKIINKIKIRKNEKLFKNIFMFYFLKKKRIRTFIKIFSNEKFTSKNDKFYVLYLIYLKHLNIYDKSNKNSLFELSYLGKKSDFQNLLNIPLLLKEIKQEFFRRFSKNKLIKKINKIIIISKDDFLNYINNKILKKNFSYIINIFFKKINHSLLEQKKENHFNLFGKKNTFIKSWKEKILTDHKIGQILLIDNIKKIHKNLIYGILRTGYNYFINLKDTHEPFLNFPYLIRKNFGIFPAKIIAIYPKIMQIRLSLFVKKK